MSDRLSQDLASLRIDRSGAPEVGGRSGGASGRRVALAGGVLTAALVVAAGVRWVDLRGASRSRAEDAPARAASAQPAARHEGGGTGGYLTATGYVVAQRTAKVSSPLPGTVLRSARHLGDTVALGEPLFELDDRDERAQMASAGARHRVAVARLQVERASLTELTTAQARTQRLVDVAAVAAADADDARTKVATQRARVAAAEAEADAAASDVSQLRVTVQRRTVLAPFAGIVASRPAVAGDAVVPGQTLLELVDPTSLVLEVEVPEARLAQVREGALCEVLFDAAPEAPLAGVALRTHPRIDRAKATAMVDVALSPQTQVAVRPDMAARITFREKRP